MSSASQHDHTTSGVDPKGGTWARLQQPRGGTFAFQQGQHEICLPGGGGAAQGPLDREPGSVLDHVAQAAPSRVDRAACAGQLEAGLLEGIDAVGQGSRHLACAEARSPRVEVVLGEEERPGHRRPRSIDELVAGNRERVHVAPSHPAYGIRRQVGARARHQCCLQRPARPPLVGVRELALDQPPPPRARGRGAAASMYDGRRAQCDRVDAAVAQPTLEVDLLGVHEEALVEAADRPEVIERDQHRCADHPVDAGASPCVCRDIVPDGAVPRSSVPPAGQRRQPGDGLVADSREVATDPGLVAELVDDPRRQDCARMPLGCREHLRHEGRLDRQIAVEDQQHVTRCRGQRPS